MKRTKLTVLTFLVVATLGGGVVGAARLLTDRGDDRVLTGLVVGPRGAPVAGAEVRGPHQTSTLTDDAGRFRIENEPGPGWVTASAEGWLPRSRVAVPGVETVVRLAPSTPDTVSFAFGGDVMFGRRYYDPDEDGIVDGQLAPDSSIEEHARLLSSVAPLLDEADIATVNLETPLIDEPLLDPTGARPSRFHPTKDYTFASAPAAAGALRELGVDVVGIANNHLYDALETGVTSTRAALDEAGFTAGEGYFGAGPDERSAWRPAYRNVRGVRIAFVGCTSILGEEHPISYVATKHHGGAAACEPDRLDKVVSAAARRADVVVASIHGGFEYGRDPSAQVPRLSDVAVSAGATLVVNHHPHVVGGIRFDDGTLTAWSLGNLLFDQTVWPTFDSYILQVAVRSGEVVSAWVEPLRIQDFRPTGVYGDDADWVARGTQARSEGPWVADDGSLWLDTSGAASGATASTNPGLSRIESGCAPGAARDVLWTGDFEDGDLTGEDAALWNAHEPSPYRKVDSDAARRGRAGVLLHRGSSNDDDVLLSVTHRVLVDERDELTLLASTRGRYGDPDAELRLSWYNDITGGSQAQTVVPLPAAEEWDGTRVDVTVPRNAVAVQPFIALSPPEDGVSQLAVDDVSMIDWSEPGCDYLRHSATVRDIAIRPHRPRPEATPLALTPVPVSAPASIRPRQQETAPETLVEGRQTRTNRSLHHR